MNYTNLIKNFLAFCFGLAMVLIFLELVFTYIIPASNSPETVYDDVNHIVKFEPNKEGVLTVGVWADQSFKWQINNAGWNSLVDYDTTDSRPLIAIIGDSFIQPIGADIDKSYPNLLRERLNPSYRVYQFGMSGAPLSQYLNMSRYVRKKYQPEVIIFNIVHNDFVESLSCYTIAGRNFMALDSATYAETYLPFHYYLGLSKLARKSHLMCYLMRNLKINSTLVSQHLPKETFDLSVNLSKQRTIKAKVEEVTDTLLTRIKIENPDSKLVFVMDGLRGKIEQNSFNDSSSLWMNEMMKEKTEANSLSFLNLNDFYEADFKQNKISFSSKTDPHWNDYGHKKVLEALYPFLLNEKIIEME